MPPLSKEMLRNFNDVISKLLWNQKRNRIEFQVLNATKDKGGLKLVSLSNKEIALKVNWVLAYMEYEEIRNLADYFFWKIQTVLQYGVLI